MTGVSIGVAGSRTIASRVAVLRRALLACALIVMFPLMLFSQQVDVMVRGGFLTDSMKIGEPTAYYLSAHYPSELTVLFPDSTYAFTPFEYQSKEYFLTHTKDGISADSAVYYLTTFEVDRVQYLSLPVYVVQQGDSAIVSAAQDSVLIVQFVAHVPDTLNIEQLPLRVNTAYEKVFYDFNLGMFLLIVAAFIAVALIVWLAFGKKIARYLLTRKLRKNHATFVDRYNGFLAQLRSNFSSPATESAVVTWKRYMEQLESRPYTKLTTKETQRLVKEPAVTHDLSRLDRAIYGHDTAVIDSLENLKRFADQQFHQKLKEVQHG